MIRLKNDAEISRIRESSILLSATLKELADLVQEGVATRELDDFARTYIEAHGGKPAFLGYMSYPASLCVSINNEVIHGIPGSRKLKRGDIVSLDLGVNLGGYFADAAITLPVGQVSKKRDALLRVTRECLSLALAQAVAGNRISDISRAVFQHAEAHRYGVVREYCGHGVGFSIHEDPQVPNYVGSGPNPRLKPGMVLCIEPMINEGSGDVELLADGWTVVTADGSDSAHFEHIIVIHRDRTEVLTSFNGIVRGAG